MLVVVVGLLDVFFGGIRFNTYYLLQVREISPYLQVVIKTDDF